MIRSPSSACALPAVAWLLGVALPAQSPERHTLRGASIAVYNLAGEIRVGPADGADVVVEVTRGGADAARLRVETGPLRGRETLRVLYPDDRVVYRERGAGWGWGTELRVREDGTFGDYEGRWSGREGREVRISGRGSGLEAWADVRVGVPRGQKIAVYLGVGKAFVANVSGDLVVDVASAEITAERTRGTLVLDTGSGAIRLVDAEGTVTLDTGSGSVDAADVRGPTLNIDTGSGEVTVARATVDQLLIDTGSGAVDATAVRARDVSIDTGSGGVDLELLSDVESLVIDTGSGGVSVTIPADFGAEAAIDTGSGDIDLAGVTVQVRRVRDDHLEGTIGDGRGRVRIETGSGSIRLKKS